MRGMTEEITNMTEAASSMAEKAAMNIAIIGGGHIGTAMACYFKHRNPQARVAMAVRDEGRFAKEILCHDVEQGLDYYATPDLITSDWAVALSGAQIVYITLPHFLIRDTFAKIANMVEPGALVGVIPGSGGCEFFFEEFFGRRARLFGFQRVPFTAKLAVYGHEVNLKSWKPYSVVGTLFSQDLDDAIAAVEACGLATSRAANFMAVSMTPSNPVLHTSRTFELFGATKPGEPLAGRRKFYVGWTDGASRTMLGMDAELHQMIDQIGDELDLSSIKPLGEHYEAPTVEAMTRKINSIPTFQTVFAPMVPAPGNEDASPEGAWVADTSSRMFTEDFPWGLAVIKGYCELFGVKTPVMDGVLSWYADYMGFEYFGPDGTWSGKDLDKTGTPQVHGVRTREDVIRLYGR